MAFYVNEVFAFIISGSLQRPEIFRTANELEIGSSQSPVVRLVSYVTNQFPCPLYLCLTDCLKCNSFRSVENRRQCT